VTRLVLISNVRLFAQGLALMLESSSEYTVAGVARDLNDCLMWIHTHRPDAVLVDMEIPHGLTTLRRLASTRPGLCVVALAVPEGESQVRACMDAGATSCVTRDAALEDLADAIDKAVERSPSIFCGVAADRPRPVPPSPPNDSNWNVLASLLKASPAPRARVEIRPSSLALPQGRVGVFTARALDVAGEPIKGARFSWASTNDVVARIHARSGIAQGMGGGQAQIVVAEMTTGCTAAANVFVVARSPSPPHRRDN